MIVAGWLLLSAAFGIWVAEIASYKSATGTLLAFLVLTAYALTVSAVFLIGVEIDETSSHSASLRSGAAAEVAARDHRHHGDAVLVHHLGAERIVPRSGRAPTASPRAP